MSVIFLRQMQAGDADALASTDACLAWLRGVAKDGLGALDSEGLAVIVKDSNFNDKTKIEDLCDMKASTPTGGKILELKVGSGISSFFEDAGLKPGRLILLDQIGTISQTQRLRCAPVGRACH